MSINIDQLLDKITNENIEINVRNMIIMHNKIQNNLLKLDTLQEKTCIRFLLSFGKWFSYYLHYKDSKEYNDTLIMQTLNLFKTAVEIFPPSSVQKMKTQLLISNLINDIGEVKPEFRAICDQVLQSVSKVALTVSESAMNNPNESPRQQIQVNTSNTNNNISFNYSVSKPDESVNSNLKISNTQNAMQQTKNMQMQSQTLPPQQQSQSLSFKPPLIDIPPTFNKVNITQQEEQFVFDLGINMKFGDCLQIYKSFYILRAQILNDYPIEYLLQCDELIKSFFHVMINCNFLEFGVSCYQILDKMLNLLETKITQNLSGIHSLYDISYEVILDENCVYSVETFTLYSLFAIIKSMYDINKMSFYIELLKKNLIFAKKLLIHSDKWNEILYHILSEIDKVVLHYRSKNYYAKVFFDFVMDLYAEMSDDDLYRIIEDENDHEIEALQFIKNIFFIIPSNDSCIKLLEAFSRIKSQSEQIDKFLIDYNNANLIFKSLEITKQMLTGETQLDIIIDNFYNILLSLKYLSNTTNESEYNTIFPNSTSPLISAIISHYERDREANRAKCVDLLIKLLSFKSQTSSQMYISLLDAIKAKGKKISLLFFNKDILHLFLSDLTCESLQDIILEIVYELFSNEDEIYNSHLEIKNIFMLIPPFNNNMKFSSLQAKIDSSLSYEGIMIKYLRFLFSKNETVRYTALNFFMANNMNNTETNIDESNMQKNYSQFKSIDTLLLIQTMTSEFAKCINNANSHIDNSIEFTPLLNILYSQKMDYNMKTSALEQLCLVIKNAKYKEYFINDIFNFVVKEIISNAKKISQSNLRNYFVSLIKTLNCIIFFNIREEKIKLFIAYKNCKELLNVILSIALMKENAKHLMSSYALMFIYYVVFYDDNCELSEDNVFPVMKFFDAFYYVNIAPVILNDICAKISNSTVLNFSITKNIIDYIYYKQHPLIKIFNFEAISSNMKNIKNLTLLDVYISLTQLLSCKSIYSENVIDECLVHIVFFFKKILPKTAEEKNLIMDFLNIIDLFLYQNKNILQYDSHFANAFIPFIQDLILNCINFANINKEFVNNLNEQNQNFIYEILLFLISHPQFYPPNNKQDVIQKFVENYQNVLVFNTENNFYKIKLLLIKFQSIYLNKMLSFPDKLFSDTINTISFFLTKYEANSAFYNLNYITWTLNYIIQLIKANKCVNVIQAKSFIFIKLLQSPFTQVKVLAIQIITCLLSKDLLEKHATILTEIYNEAINSNDKVLITNYFNFLIKCFEFVLSNKTIDVNHSNSDSDFTGEIIAMNEKICDQAEIIKMISKLIDKNESIECAMMLKYINTCMNLDIENIDYIKGIFFNFTFYDHINDLILKETKTLSYIANIIDNNESALSSRKNLNGCFKYTDANLRKKIIINASMESTLYIKECLNLIIRSFPYITHDTYVLYRTHICEIYLNIIQYNEILVKLWNVFINENNKTFNKVLQSYAMKYFAFLHFVFDAGFDCEDIGANKQRLNNVCYDMMKFDSISEYNSEIKIMFSKILPYLIEGKKTTKIKNEGDSLLEIMSTFKQIYEIKVDIYGKKMKCVFKIENKNIKIKNDLVNSISSLILISQSCKRIFIKSKFINTFYDYIIQLTEKLLNINLDNKINSTTNQTPSNEIITNRQNGQMLTEYIVNEYANVLILMQNLFYKFDACEERDSMFISEKKKRSKFLKLIYNIFYDTLRYTDLFKNYLKLLINIVSNDNGGLSRYFLIPITNNKDTLLSLLLDHFAKSIFVLASNPNFEFYIQFLKCLLQHKPISSTLLKTKFSENIKCELLKIIQNRKTFSNPKQVKIIQELMEIFVSLSFDSEQAKKFGNKEFIVALSEVLLKTKNENVIYNIIFFYRNISFVNQIKTVFMSEGSLLGTIFALLSGEYSIRIKCIITHLIWVLLFNNQTLRTMLSRDEFKGEIKAIHIHLQKELDMEKLEEECKNDSLRDKNKKLLEETCLNLTKIMHIIEG